MNNASFDVDARRTFREELRGRRVALRSFIPRDDIDDIEIVAAEDPEVSATRQVLKIELAAAPATTRAPAERTAEIDALDVLESIDIVQRCEPTVTVTAKLAAIAPPALDVEDDAFFAHADPPSTGAVTFHLGDSYVDEIGPTIELHGTSPDERRRRLGWIVGTVIACAAVMTAAAAITEQTQSASSETPAFSAQSPAPHAAAAPATAAVAAGPIVALTPATTTAYPSIPEMDVRSLPAALAGTIVGAPRHPLFVDGKRLQSSTAIVACGKHTVKSGAFRAARVIDVPCGGTVALK